MPTHTFMEIPSNIPTRDAANSTITVVRAALNALTANLDNSLGVALHAAVLQLMACRGRIVVSGVGKSGHIGQKIAATLASTGSPAFFVHPTEASHGDLGMITEHDVLLVLSWSGETVELANLLRYAQGQGIPVVSITSSATSALGRASSVVLALPAVEEACPHGLAPTTSTTLQLVMGDCLAMAAMQAKGFQAQDFKVLHPGGSLGAQLKRVQEVMHGADALPLAPADALVSDALVLMTGRAFGCLGVVDEHGLLVGIVTDGDLRRHMGRDLLGRRVNEIMTADPKTIAPQALATAAAQQMRAQRITALFVVADGRPVGILHVHDLLRMGLS